VRQSRNKLNVFNLFRHCRKDEISFDIVAKKPKPATLSLKNNVAGFGDNVAGFGDIVAGVDGTIGDIVAYFGDIVAGVDGALGYYRPHPPYSVAGNAFL